MSSVAAMCCKYFCGGGSGIGLCDAARQGKAGELPIGRWMVGLGVVVGSRGCRVDPRGRGNWVWGNRWKVDWVLRGA